MQPRAPGIPRWKGPGDNAAFSHPPAAALTHIYTQTFLVQKNKTPNLKSTFQTIREIPSTECISGAFHPRRQNPNGDGGGVGILSSAVPQERGRRHPYQLHGGVILLPAPQHHAHLTSGRGGRRRGERGKAGEGGPKHLPARPRRSRLLVWSCPLGPAPPGIPDAPAPGRCAPGTLPGLRASLARSQPPPAAAKPNKSLRAPAPAPRSSEAGDGGVAGSPPPRPAAAPRGPQRFNGQTNPCGGQGKGERRLQERGS